MGYPKDAVVNFIGFNPSGTGVAEVDQFVGVDGIDLGRHVVESSTIARGVALPSKSQFKLRLWHKISRLRAAPLKERCYGHDTAIVGFLPRRLGIFQILLQFVALCLSRSICFRL